MTHQLHTKLWKKATELREEAERLEWCFNDTDADTIRIEDVNLYMEEIEDDLEGLARLLQEEED